MVRRGKLAKYKIEQSEKRMTIILYLSKVRNFFIGVSLLLVGIPLPVSAKYKPPKQTSAPSGPTTSTGRRGGCSRDRKTSLTALAPHQHVGQTTTSYPTFLWYVPESNPYPLRFQLYALGATGKQLLYTTQFHSTPGLMQHKLPPNQAGLVKGRRYSWQVILFCNPNRPSTAVVAGAKIDVMSLPTTLSNSLASMNQSENRSMLYAESGFWYDALAEISKPEYITLSAAKTSLIQDLITLETANRALPDNKQAKQLKEILETENFSQN